MSNNFITREIRQSDIPYICRTILFSLIKNDFHTARINKDSFLVSHNKILKRIISRSKTIVIADQQEENILYAFIIYEQGLGEFDAIHYAYVRKEFRGMGLLKNLVPVIKTRDNVVFTHATDNLKPAKLKSYWHKSIFDPYLLQ